MNYEKQITDDILNQLIKCNDNCGTAFERPKSTLGYVDFCLKTLPGASYILGQLVNYVFSNKLTSGRVGSDIVLQDFLYSLNEVGETNYSVLQSVTKYASSHGECGLRWYKDGIYMVKPGTYATLTIVEDGIEQIVGYITTKNRKNIEKDTFTFSDFSFDNDEEITNAFLGELERRGLIFLDKSDFVNVRNDTSELHGKSPFLSDTLRIDLLITTYERLIHELNYDGPGRVILWAKNGILADDINEHATSEIMRANPLSQANREKKAREELKRITEEIRNSGSDNAILLSNAFERNVQHLPRVTKATEFFDWIKQEGVIVAQILGILPGLLELGDISGNVSMEKIIDNAMLNNIIPLRERYAVQFSSLLASKLGIEKIYFDKYELQQAEDVNTMRTKVVNMMKTLSDVDADVARKLIENFGTMLLKEIHQDGHIGGELKELTIAKRREEYVKNGTDFGAGEEDSAYRRG